MRHSETDSSEETTDLTQKQLAALPYLVASPSLSEGARLASIGRATLYRWMNDDEFRRTLERTWNEVESRCKRTVCSSAGIQVIFRGRGEPACLPNWGPDLSGPHKLSLKTHRKRRQSREVNQLCLSRPFSPRTAAAPHASRGCVASTRNAAFVYTCGCAS